MSAGSNLSESEQYHDLISDLAAVTQKHEVMTEN